MTSYCLHDLNVVRLIHYYTVTYEIVDWNLNTKENMKDVIWNGEGKKLVGYSKLNLCTAQCEHEWRLVLGW